MARSNDLYLDIRNPEYMPRGELIISELAALNYSVGKFNDGKIEGRNYRAKGRSTVVQVVSTDPYVASSPNEPAAWEGALRDAELGCNGPFHLAAQVLADSFAGTESEKGVGQSASPMAPGLALLQDSRGVVGRRNPFNVAAAIERMYTLGLACSLVEEQRTTAADQWNRATKARLEADPLLRVLDTAARNGLLPNFSEEDRESGAALGNPCLGSNTPFSWFRESWDRLASPAWVEALPARTWADWAMAVIRSGLAFGYLWEIRWHQTMARLVLQGGDQLRELTWEGLVAEANQRGPLLDWIDQSAPIGMRDVASKLKDTCKVYAGLNEEVQTAFRSGTPTSVGEALLSASEDQQHRDRFKEALRPGSNENCLELVRYMLLGGSAYGRHADHYYLLRKVGRRYTVVDPATEWIAAITSLSMDAPGSETNLSAVSMSLRQLGLEPSTAELTKHLELAGLARGAHDADGAIVVRSAF